MKTTITTAVIYARYSTDRQDARSIDDQSRKCREWAERNAVHIVGTYSDAAVSGSHTVRAELQRLLADAASSKGRSFNVVIVDDLSRLSRDMFDMGRIVFQDLAALNVRVLDVMTGRSSDEDSSRQLFAAMGMGNDLFLQMVRKETHRGLEGRFLENFSTGGRCYGFRSVMEENPPNPQHPRMRPVIHENQAEIVRRIFRARDEGEGYASIAGTLNAEGIPAPYDGDGGKLKKSGKGWQASTIRSLLLNERYIGKNVWNKRKHVRIPGKKNRRQIQNPPELWRTQLIPENAIIDADLWARVQNRFTTEKRGRGRPSGSSKQYVHLLSGILRCGTCSSPLGITGSKQNRGTKYFSLGCTRRHTRGATMCANNMLVSETKAEEFILGEIRHQLIQPGVIAEIVRQFRREAKTKKSKVDTASPGTQVLRQISETERRVNNFTEALGKIGYSTALAEKLAAEEKRLTDLRTKAAASNTPESPAEVALPPIAMIEDYVYHLLETLQKCPADAKALLKAHLG
jgi:DNA invertase Pin-like site-specific DNA recombinase